MVHNLDKWVTHIPYCVRRSLLFCFFNLWFIVRIKNFHDQITTHSISMVFHISNVRRLSFWSDVLVNSNKYKRTKPSDCSERGLLNSFSCCYWNFFFFSFCLSIFHLIYFALTMYGNSTHIHIVTFIHTTKGTNRKWKTKQEKKEDIIIRMLLLLHRTFRSPLFAVERYCFRVILHCRDTFDIKSSVCIRVYIVCAYRKQR